MSPDKLKVYVPAAFLVLLGFVVAYQFVDPAPPSMLTFSAGQKGGAYYAHAERYRAYLKAHGIEVAVQESAGSIENVQRLADGSADIAFVQSGIPAPENARLLSLGSMYYEPLWLFLAPGVEARFLSELKGKRIAAGMQGSGTRVLALDLLKQNGVDENSAQLINLGAADAADALLGGEADALFLVAAASSDTVQKLLGDTAGSNRLPGSAVRLLNFVRADAYDRRLDSLSAVTLPEGALNLALNLPAADTRLLATTATLVVNESLHPALQDLIMQAAAEIHGGSSLFSAAGAFPAARNAGMQLSDEAARYYKSGPPLLQRYLPFWAATLVDRLKVMLLPLIALLLPLIKIMPPLYRWRIRSRIYRWYEELNRIDAALADGFDPVLLEDLENIRADIRKVHVPLAYAEELYELRTHLALIRETAERARTEQTEV